jgi:hypothetical protein
VTIAIHLPVWLLWTLGIAAGVIVLALAIMGALLLWFGRNWGSYDV